MSLIELVPKARSENIVVQDLGNEILIYDLKNDKAYCLNETSTIVWQACDGRRNIAEIIDFASRKLDSTAHEDFIWFAINQLKKEKLLENGDQLPNYFAGMTRREIVKKIGLRTMIVLPLIASMVTPAAATSASVCTTNLSMSCICNFMACDMGDMFSVNVSCGGTGDGGTTDCNSMGRAACMCIATMCNGTNNQASGTCQ